MHCITQHVKHEAVHSPPEFHLVQLDGDSPKGLSPIHQLDNSRSPKRLDKSFQQGWICTLQTYHCFLLKIFVCKSVHAFFPVSMYNLQRMCSQVAARQQGQYVAPNQQLRMSSPTHLKSFRDHLSATASAVAATTACHAQADERHVYRRGVPLKHFKTFGAQTLCPFYFLIWEEGILHPADACQGLGHFLLDSMASTMPAMSIVTSSSTRICPSKATVSQNCILPANSILRLSSSPHGLQSQGTFNKPAVSTSGAFAGRVSRILWKDNDT